ncbi:DUF4019 domain-containing protein [Pandoraea fibrosis]|uniref:DUF4019 domain-containing protein n=1 Tax=Pandoraea fibrosis TaxID=1891094 RepID=A0A5E4Y2B4_9BURK|nr:DUF4019 domain-containing protein [Pandoraea fibrosis]QHE93544.1 DUF4019 domain-containing protein [Pandoraea fibrosis]QHF12894.1 DUF4019 domain-containing protein [Pandoraea fibrosis]VVE42750.1 hypothetical protein PFI31113_04218 [Pandoraea fibrosis]
MSTTQFFASHRPRRFRRFGVLRALALAAGVIGCLSALPVQAQQEPSQRRKTQPPLFSIPASGVTAPAADINRDVRAALEGANLWLGLTDINRGTQSWEQAAPVFQRAISAEDWAQSLQAARLPLGKVKSRKTKDAVFTRTLPGQPDGEYVVIQYDTVFEKKAEAHEMVTMVFGIDSRWRVAGYLVR